MKTEKLIWWQLEQKGAKFHNGKGSAREVVDTYGPDGTSLKHTHPRYIQRSDVTVKWKKIEGPGPSEGTCKWSSWRAWVKGIWYPPRPNPLPVPQVTQVEVAFATGKHTPPWYWVPDEFKDRSGLYENDSNVWCRLIEDLFMGRKTWQEWRALPKEGVDPEMALLAVRETLGNWGIKHQRKVATAAWMLSEWFSDWWWEGDTHSRVGKVETPKEVT